MKTPDTLYVVMWDTADGPQNAAFELKRGARIFFNYYKCDFLNMAIHKFTREGVRKPR